MHVAAEIEIRRSAKIIFEFAVQPHTEPSWINGIIESKPLTDGPVREGTRVLRVATFLWKRIEYVLEVTKFNPPAQIVMESVKSPFPMIVTYEFEPRDGGTLARVILGGDAKGFYRIAKPILSRLSRRSIQRDLKNLKRLVESA